MGSKLDWKGYYDFLRHQVGDGMKWISYQIHDMKILKDDTNIKRSDFPITLIKI